jgi:hypothetical protein
MANIGYELFEESEQEQAKWDEGYTPRKAARVGK